MSSEERKPEVNNPFPGVTARSKSGGAREVNFGGRPLTNSTPTVRDRMPGCSGLSMELRKQEMVKLLLDGFNVKECAELIGISYTTGINYLRDPEVRSQLRSLHADLLGKLDTEVIAARVTKLQTIDELATLALGRMKGILEDQTAHPGIVAKVATDVLDRCPETSRSKKLDITERKITLSGEDLGAALQAMKEIEDRHAMKEALQLAEQASSENPTNDSRIE